MPGGDGRWRSFRKVLQRKRVFEPDQLDQGNLRRCLNSWDLTGLGLGSTLGVGVYVLVGSVALRIAGPSIILSFLIAAVASLFAGLCYAEFGSRVPRAGSAYIYTYVTVGELLAFLIGWNMVLEGLFGTASVAKGLSTYLDSMLGGAMSAWFRQVMPMGSPHFSPYFDIFAFLVVVFLGVLLAVGVRESSSVNNVLALLNMLVILFIVIAGAFTANVDNWSIPWTAVPEGFGGGGFFPYGVWGMLRGAAVCFYGFVGFDAISASGEEVEEPRRSIPQAILTVLVIVLLVYAGVATVVTMMVPYYALDRVAAVATAFTYVDWDWARWVVSIGAVFGICASLFGSMFPLPRLLYAMASDGLLVHWFAKVSSSRSPVVATLFPASIIAVLAAALELDQLILMMCVGTLLSYTIVAACVIVLRYRSKVIPENNPGFMKQLFGCGGRVASRTSARLVSVALFFFICVCVTTALVGVRTEEALIPVAVLHGIALVLLAIIAIQPQAKEELAFKTPFVPLVPCLSIYVNIHLMILVNVQTWIRILIWIAIGIPVYIICLICYKRNKTNMDDNLKTVHSNMNGKPTVQIVIVAPTPINTLTKTAKNDDSDTNEAENNVTQTNITQINVAQANVTNVSETNKVIHIKPYITDEIINVSETNEIARMKPYITDEIINVSETNEITRMKPYITDEIINVSETNKVRHIQPYITDEIIVQQAVIENHYEKEAKIIDLLDQVIQAEEDSYGEVISLKEQNDDENLATNTELTLTHRKSLSELSDAGSDVSGQVLSKYDVVALVHREDLPIVSEEEEKYDKERNIENNELHRNTENNELQRNTENNELRSSVEEINDPGKDTEDNERRHIENYELQSSFEDSGHVEDSTINMTTVNDDESETNSRTDESGYSDTLDRVLHDPLEDTREEEPVIPVPPPLDEKYFASPNFKKAHTISSRPSRKQELNFEDEENKPRESVLSNCSDNTNIVFGSERQMSFMSKLNNIYQKKMSEEPVAKEILKRSNSTGNVAEERLSIVREQPPIFLDLKREIMAIKSTQLRPIVQHVEPKDSSDSEDDINHDISLSRKDLKSKLESIYATGGPMIFKTKPKSNPPTPEEAYQTDSSIESIPQIPKVEKNDTLKRQKDRFGEVLKEVSFRLSLNKDDVV